MGFYSQKYIRPLSLIISVTSVILLTTPVLAKGRPDGVGNGSHENSTDAVQFHASTASESGEVHVGTDSAFQKHGHGEGFETIHLANAKLQACQTHAGNISKRSSHMVDLATNQEKVFDSIAAGVENRYLTKIVPQGLTVLNYDALVAAIGTQKAALLPLLQTVQTDVTNFACDGNNPSAQLLQFKTDLQAVIQGLKSYKTSVRNLIVAVASIRGVKDTGSTPSISPTGSISVTPTGSVSATPSVALTPTIGVTATVTPTP